jgi:hypothetical protein
LKKIRADAKIILECRHYRQEPPQVVQGDLSHRRLVEPEVIAGKHLPVENRQKSAPLIA